MRKDFMKYFEKIIGDNRHFTKAMFKMTSSTLRKYIRAEYV